MTKKVLKEKYMEWNKEISALEQRKEEIWNKLQDMNEEKGGGQKWCSMVKLVEELMRAGLTYQTMDIVSEYYQIEGQQEALRKLATATNNFEI